MIHPNEPRLRELKELLKDHTLTKKQRSALKKQIARRSEDEG